MHWQKVISLALLFFFNGAEAWKSTPAGTYNGLSSDYEYPITKGDYEHPITIACNEDPCLPTFTSIDPLDIHPTPFKVMKNDKLKRYLRKRGYDWIANVMP